MLKCNTRHIYHESVSHMVHLHPGEKLVDREAGCPTLHPWLLYQHLPLELLQDEKIVKKDREKCKDWAVYLLPSLYMEEWVSQNTLTRNWNIVLKYLGYGQQRGRLIDSSLLKCKLYQQTISSSLVLPTVFDWQMVSVKSSAKQNTKQCLLGTRVTWNISKLHDDNFEYSLYQASIYLKNHWQASLTSAGPMTLNCDCSVTWWWRPGTLSVWQCCLFRIFKELFFFPAGALKH